MSSKRGGGKPKGGTSGSSEAEMQQDGISPEVQRKAKQLKEDFCPDVDVEVLEEALKKCDMNENDTVDYVFSRTAAELQALVASRWMPTDKKKPAKKKDPEFGGSPSNTFTQPRNTGPSGPRGGGKDSGFQRSPPPAGRGGGKHEGKGKGSGRGQPAPALVPPPSAPAPVPSVQAPPRDIGPAPTQAETWGSGNVSLAQRIAQTQQNEQMQKEQEARAAQQAAQARAQQSAMSSNASQMSSGRGSSKGQFSSPPSFDNFPQPQPQNLQASAPTTTKGRGRGKKATSPHHTNDTGSPAYGNMGRGMQPTTNGASPSGFADAPKASSTPEWASDVQPVAGDMNGFDSAVPAGSDPAASASFSVQDLFAAQAAQQQQPSQAQPQSFASVPAPQPKQQLPGSGGFEVSSMPSAYTTGNAGPAKAPVNLPPQSLNLAQAGSDNWQFGDFGGMSFGSQDTGGQSRMPGFAQQAPSQPDQSSQQSSQQDGYDAAPGSISDSAAEGSTPAMPYDLQSADPNMADADPTDPEGQAQMHSPYVPGQYPFMMGFPGAAMGPPYGYDPSAADGNPMYSNPMYGAASNAYAPVMDYAKNVAGGAAAAGSTFARDGKYQESAKGGTTHSNSPPPSGPGQPRTPQGGLSYQNPAMMPQYMSHPAYMNPAYAYSYPNMGPYPGFQMPATRGGQFKGGANAQAGYIYNPGYDDYYANIQSYSQQMQMNPPQMQQQPAVPQGSAESTTPATNSKSTPAVSAGGAASSAMSKGMVQGSTGYATQVPPQTYPMGAAARMPFQGMPMQGGAGQQMGMAPQPMAHPAAMGSATMPSGYARPPSQFAQPHAWPQQ